MHKTTRRHAGLDVPTIVAADLARRLARGEKVLVLDSRQPETYADLPGVIPGSVRILPSEIPDRYTELRRDLPIVAYCT